MVVPDGMKQAVARRRDRPRRGGLADADDDDAALRRNSPGDPVTLATVAVLLCTAALACYIPARRATRVDPVDRPDGLSEATAHKSLDPHRRSPSLAGSLSSNRNSCARSVLPIAERLPAGMPDSYRLSAHRLVGPPRFERAQDGDLCVEPQLARVPALRMTFTPSLFHRRSRSSSRSSRSAIAAVRSGDGADDHPRKAPFAHRDRPCRSRWLTGRMGRSFRGGAHDSRHPEPVYSDPSSNIGLTQTAETRRSLSHERGAAIAVGSRAEQGSLRHQHHGDFVTREGSSRRPSPMRGPSPRSTCTRR